MFLIIFHTVLVFVFIFDVKFFHVSHFASLIVLCALALQFLKISRFFCWVCQEFSECGMALSYCFFALIIIQQFVEFRLSGGSWYAFLCDS